MKSSHSSLFLMELIVSILFFSVAGAACIQLFVKAHVLGQNTREQNQAVIWSQNLSSLWLACDDKATSKERIAFLYGQLTQDYGRDDGSIQTDTADDGTRLILSFDKNWQLCTDKGVTYRIVFADYGYDVDSRLLLAEISCIKEEAPFYSLPLVHHPAAERGPFHE